MGDLLDAVETFLANGGEVGDAPTMTFAEMQAKYGDAWAEDFKAQFKAFTGIEIVHDEESDDQSY